MGLVIRLKRVTYSREHDSFTGDFSSRAKPFRIQKIMHETQLILFNTSKRMAYCNECCYSTPTTDPQQGSQHDFARYENL